MNMLLVSRLARDHALRRWETSLHEAAHLLASVIVLGHRHTTAVLVNGGDGGVTEVGPGRGWQRAIVAQVGEAAEQVLTWLYDPPPLPLDADEFGQSAAAARLRRLWRRAQRANAARQIRSDGAVVGAYATCAAREKEVKKYARKFVLQHQGDIVALARALFCLGEVSVLRSDDGCLEITTTTT